MSQPTNIVDRYTGYRAVRENLANVIYNIAMMETPFISNIGKEDVENTYFEWQVDTLASPNTVNVQIDGDDASNDSRAMTNRVGNYTQISRKTIQVSGTQEAVTKAGFKSQMAYEIAKAGKELKRDAESMLLLNQQAVVGNSTTARRTAGLPAWIRTNVSMGASGVNPTLSGSTDGYPNAAYTAGTTRAITETLLKTLAQSVWSVGGSLDMLMVDGLNKQTVSTFAGLAVNRFELTKVKPLAIIGAADVYLSDFGEIQIVPNAFMPHAYAALIDTGYVSLATLRAPQTRDLANTGDSIRKMLIWEYGLKVRNEKAHGIIRDLT